MVIPLYAQCVLGDTVFGQLNLPYPIVMLSLFKYIMRESRMTQLCMVSRHNSEQRETGGGEAIEAGNGGAGGVVLSADGR